MKRRKKDPKYSARLAVAFIVAVFVFIAISLVFRAAAIVAKSIYDNTNRFTIKVESAKGLKIMSFSGRSRSLSLLDVKGDVKNLNINKFLAIPIDASIATSLDIKGQKVSDLTASLILNYADLETNLTILDMARIYLYARGVADSDIYYRSVSLSSDSTTIDKIVLELFKDETIEKDNLTIKVVNSTNVNGLGGRSARLISNMGGNVVLIESLDKTEPQSAIYYFGKKSYTVEKLEKVLGYAVYKLETKPIADIVIVIGKESTHTDIF